MTGLLAEREHAMQSAFEFAPPDFAAEYREFILRVAEKNDEFTAEQCQLAYRDILGKPQPDEWRSTGNIFRTLSKEGKIKKIGFGWSTVRGVPVPKYSKA